MTFYVRVGSRARPAAGWGIAAEIPRERFLRGLEISGDGGLANFTQGEDPRGHDLCSLYQSETPKTHAKWALCHLYLLCRFKIVTRQTRGLCNAMKNPGRKRWPLRLHPY
jgi:hypothetical protein